MWQQNYQFVGGSLGLSALVAATPLLVLFYLLGVRRQPAWIAALSALGPLSRAPSRWSPSACRFSRPPPPRWRAPRSACFRSAGSVFSSILLYRIAVDTGKFEIIKDSIGAFTDDRRLQLLLIAFSFSSFIEGAAGFGSPVAVSAAMLAGLGFPPF